LSPEAGRALGRWYLRHESAVLGALGLTGLGLAWELAARAGAIDPVALASPGHVGAALARQWASGELPRDLRASALEFALAYVLAVGAGVALGLLMGLARGAAAGLEPLVWLLYSAPLVAFQPLLIVWLGFGAASVVALAAGLASLPIALNVQAAVRATDPAWLRTVRAFGGRRRHEVLCVILPAAVPMFMAGLRIGAGRALVGIVAGEMLGADAGLGFRLVFYGARLRAADVLVPLLGVVLIGLAVTQAVRLAERRLPGRPRGVG
jgi:ABC-type nitrate/sulfonate/bicarbonate transport system permease component